MKQLLEDIAFVLALSLSTTCRYYDKAQRYAKVVKVVITLILIMTGRMSAPTIQKEPTNKLTLNQCFK